MENHEVKEELDGMQKESKPEDPKFEAPIEGKEIPNKESENLPAMEEDESQEGEGDLSVLKSQLEEERRRAEELYQRLLRSQADFENYRKRVLREKEELAKYGIKPLLEKLLPVVDNLERAIQSAKGEGGDLETFISGIEMVHRQMLEAMKSEGAHPLETVGKPFDPFYHQAIAQEESDGEKGIVLEEYQKGYMLKDKLIRPAMVKVSS